MRVMTWSSGSLQLMPFDPALRAEGRDWPLEAVTMVGNAIRRRVVSGHDSEGESGFHFGVAVGRRPL